MVRAKFVCEKALKEEGHYSFRAVTSGSEENNNFFKYTPAGSILISVVNDNVSFEQGKEYYVDFTESN